MAHAVHIGLNTQASKQQVSFAPARQKSPEQPASTRETVLAVSFTLCPRQHRLMGLNYLLAPCSSTFLGCNPLAEVTMNDRICIELQW